MSLPPYLMLLHRFATGDVKPAAKHYYNAHFPGLYSIVLDRNGDLLTRAFIAKPHQLSKDLRNEQGTFLWHRHGYDFRETSIAGSVTNICVRGADGSVDYEYFYQYHINAGIDTGLPPTLVNIEPRVRFKEYLRQTVWPFESFELAADVIHRVVFKPDLRTYWFACIVEELRKVPAPNVVYSPAEIDSIPHADQLYIQIHDDQARRVVQGLIESLEPSE